MLTAIRPGPTDGPAPSPADILIAGAEEARLRGEADRARAGALEVLRLTASDPVPSGARVRALAAEARLSSRQGDHDAALLSSQMALRAVPPHDRELRFLALECRATVLTNASRLEEARRLVPRLRAAAALLPLSAAWARSDWTEGRLEVVAGRWDRAEDLLDRAAGVGREGAPGSPETAAMAMALQARLRAWQGRAREAHATADALERFGGRPEYEAEACLCRAEADLAAGDGLSASLNARRALARDAPGATRRRSWAHTLLADVALLEDRVEEARRRAIEAGVGLRSPGTCPAPSHRLAAALIRGRRRDELRLLRPLPCLLPHERLMGRRVADLVAHPAPGSLTAELRDTHPVVVAAFRTLQGRLGLAPRPSLRLVTARGSFTVSAQDVACGLPCPARLVFDARQGLLTAPDGGTHDLSRRRREARLLATLMDEPGRTYSRGELYERVWERPFNPEYHDNDVYVILHHVRKLVGDRGARASFIVRNDDGRYGMALDGPPWAMVAYGTAGLSSTGRPG